MGRVLLCVFFCGSNGINATDIHKDMFALYGGKCLSRKAVHNWVVNVSLRTKSLKRRSGGAEVRKWLRQQSEDFYAADFDALVKLWTSVSMLVEDMSIRKCIPQVRIPFSIHL
jgi:hypothetical protein